ncbi:MAG: preprotein translocase subunit SecE [Geobacteraceae bacterium]|nr:preprotein translocase subunit SecE [Geobacteraceae bacterium]
MIAKAKTFLDDVRAELHRVTWPARKETISTTWVVVFIIIVIAFYLFSCDLVINKILKAFLR